MKILNQVFLLCFCLTNCDSFNTQPPMFKCKVNIENWEPEIHGSLGVKYTGKAFFRMKAGYFDIYGSSNDYSLGMTIKIYPGSKIELNRKYPIQSQLIENAATASFVLSSLKSGKQDYRVKANSGYIEITNLDNQYFSGLFEFDLEKKILSKTYKIRTGQFNKMVYSVKDY